MSRFYTRIILMSFFAVLYAILHAISEKKRDFRNCYGVFKRDKEIEYELYSIFYWLHDSRHVGYLRTPIDRQTFENEIDEYLDKVKECTAFRDKVFGKIGTRFARCAYKHDNWFGCLLNITILWSHICYNTLNVLFLLCSLSAISLHLKHVHLLNYMEAPHKVVYYAIPIGFFFLILAIGSLKKNITWPLVKSAFIVSFVVSLTFAIAYNDWSEAKESYEYAMESKFGKHWEEILDEAESDAIETTWHYH